jgi:hypothetical protein
VTSGSASPLPSMLFASCSNSAGSMLISVMYAYTNTLILTCGVGYQDTQHFTHCTLCSGVATTDDVVFGRAATPQCKAEVPILCFVIYLWQPIVISAPSIDTKRQ